MKIPFKIVLFPVIILILGACAGKTIPFSTNTKKATVTIPTDYEEDLSSVRPHFEEKYQLPKSTPVTERKVERERTAFNRTVPMTVNDKVEMVLDTMASQNKSIKFAQGYRILLYVGNERQEVDNAKIYIIQNYPELNNYLSYNQPTYKLKVGDFVYRMEAERYFSSIKSQFSGATIVADKIDIRKSLMAK